MGKNKKKGKVCLEEFCIKNHLSFNAWLKLFCRDEDPYGELFKSPYHLNKQFERHILYSSIKLNFEDLFDWFFDDDESMWEFFIASGYGQSLNPEVFRTPYESYDIYREQYIFFEKLNSHFCKKWKKYVRKKGYSFTDRIKSSNFKLFIKKPKKKDSLKLKTIRSLVNKQEGVYKKLNKKLKKEV